MECEKFVVIFVIFFKMATSNKQKLKESIIQYYKLNSEKGFWYTYKQKQKELDHGIVIRMFDNLKGRIHIAKENGLSSLIKF